MPKGVLPNRSASTSTPPEPQKGVLNDKKMILKYGYKDKKGRPGLCVEINAISTNRQGLRLHVENAKNRLYILHARDGKLWFWDIGKLKPKIERLLFVVCDSKRENACEYFRCVEAYYLTGFQETVLFEPVQKGLVVINLRMHLEPDGSVRNRGTAFRGKFNDLKACYGSRESLIKSDVAFAGQKLQWTLL
jgi:hypothetical protein